MTPEEIAARRAAIATELETLRRAIDEDEREVERLLDLVRDSDDTLASLRRQATALDFLSLRTFPEAGE